MNRRPQPITGVVVVVGLLLLVAGCGDSLSNKTRYSVSSEGVITDSRTGLEWVVGPDKGTNYNPAVAWVKACRIAGGGWRMPTRAELRGLYTKGLGHLNMAPVFRTTGTWFWAEPKDSSNAWAVCFPEGIESYSTRDDISSFDDDKERVFAVRSAKK